MVITAMCLADLSRSQSDTIVPSTPMHQATHSAILAAEVSIKPYRARAPITIVASNANAALPKKTLANLLMSIANLQLGTIVSSTHRKVPAEWLWMDGSCFGKRIRNYFYADS